MANIMWTADLIKNLKRFVDSKDFKVVYNNEEVVGLDLSTSCSITETEFYFHDYYGQPPQPVLLPDSTPKDFKVFRLIEWDFWQTLTNG